MTRDLTRASQEQRKSPVGEARQGTSSRRMKRDVIRYNAQQLCFQLRQVARPPAQPMGNWGGIWDANLQGLLRLMCPSAETQ